MEKYFWREKNANQFIGKYDVIEPTKEELFEEMINKLKEKTKMIKVIFNPVERAAYLSKKGKNIPSDTSEILIQQKIGSRVVVDFLQLIQDICLLKDAEISAFNVNDMIKDIEALYEQFKLSVAELKVNLIDNLTILFKNVLNLIDVLDLKYSKLEEERKLIEDKEGSFYSGKYVFK